MAGKTPGTPRKNISKKSATKQTKPVTPISQEETNPAEQAVTAGNQGLENSTGTLTENPAESSTQRTVTPISHGTGKAAENRKLASAIPGIDEEIRRRAYELYEERGRQHGFDHDDWSRAEKEVLSRFKREKSA